jgi:hypothetical protein
MTFRFSGVLSSESTYLEKTPTAQLTRIDVGERLFFRTFNTHNKCTGLCRFVRGIPVGSGTPQGITGLGVAWCGWTTVVVGSQ